MSDQNGSEQTVSDPHILHPADVEPFDRGTGVKTLPLVGKWNTQGNKVTTGITIFGPGTQIPLHTHNVEETVMVLEGEATAVVGIAAEALDEAGVLEPADRLPDRELLDDDRISHAAPDRGRKSRTTVPWPTSE